MKSIFLSDSDEEAIVELYDKTNNDSFKDKQKKERLWEQLSATRNLPIKTVKKWFKTQRTRYGKLTQDKQLRREENDRSAGRAVSVFFEVTSEGREFPGLLRSSHHRDLLQLQPQFQIYPDTQNLRWKSALHQMLLISLPAPVLRDDSLQSPLPPLL